MKAWKRILKVTLFSSTTGSKMTFGKKGGNDLNISVSGSKYLSVNKDTFTVKISNLTYYEMIKILQGKYYKVQIEAGYESIGVYQIYEGGVLYISNQRNDHNTNTVIILCASQLVAQFGQTKMNTSLYAGINYYAALDYVCKQAGIKNANIDEEFKNQFLKETTTYSTSVTNVISNLLDQVNNDGAEYRTLVSTDSTDSILNIWSSVNKLPRTIKLTKKNLIAENGYPKLTEDGLNLTILPTLEIKIGDIVTIDNSIIDLSVSSQDEVYKNYSLYIDSMGEYIVWQVDFSLQNRGSNFDLNLTLKSKSLYGS